jgi:S1-C subfamily serine protease
MESMSEAIQWDDEENDEFEARVVELKKKRMQQRFGTSIQNTVQLSFKSDSSIGVVLGQVEPGLSLSDKALDMDTLQYNQRANNDETDALLLRKSVDGAFRGVVVLSVDPNGQGWEAGIRPGNVLTASSATVGEVRDDDIVI